MENPCVVVSVDNIVFVKNVVTTDVTPYAGSDIVVDVIATKYYISALRKLHAAGLPLEIEAPVLFAQMSLSSTMMFCPLPPIPIWPL